MTTFRVLPLGLFLFMLPAAAFCADASLPKSVASAEPSGRKVGQMGSTKRLVFEGNQTFSADELSHGLRAHADWLLAAHPAAPLADFLKVTRTALERGYQRAGFPSVVVKEGRLEINPDRLVFEIVEGPRYTAGTVTVSGTKSIKPELIIEKLTTAEKTATDTDKQKSTSSKKPKIDWKQGKPAPLDATRPGELQRAVLKILEQHGLMQAKVQADIVRDDTARTAALQVKILAEGPAAILDKVEFTGLKRDSDVDVMKYLGLAPGQPFLSGRVAEIENLLLKSARYTSYKVTATPRQAGQPEMNLKIELVEMPETPKLGVALNDNQKALLLASAWANEIFSTGSEDLLLKWSHLPKEGGRQDLELIYNSQHGAHLTVTVTDDVAGKLNPRRLALHYAQEAMTGLFSMQEGRVKQWMHTPAGKGLAWDYFVKFETNEPKDGVTTGNINFGGSFKPAVKNVTSKLALTMTPAAALLFSLKYAAQLQNRDGRFVMQSPAAPGGDDFSMAIDTATGRVREIAIGTWEKGHGGFFRFTVTTAVGALDRATRELEADSAGLVNAYEGKEALASWAGFLTAGFLQGGFGKSPPAKPETIPPRSHAAYELARSLSVSGAQVYNAIFSSSESDYLVPNAPDKPVETKLSGSIISQYALFLTDALAGNDTWPWLLAREAFYSMNGRTEYTGLILNQVRADPQLGPVGCYLASVLLDWTLPAAAGEFRQMAQAKLTAQDFRKDWGLLAQNVSERQRGEITALLEKIRSGAQVEVGLLEDILGNFESTTQVKVNFGNFESTTKVKVNPSIQTFVTELRRDPGRPLAEAVASAMDRVWDETLSAWLKDKLMPKGKDGKAVDPAKVAALVGGTEISREELEKSVAARIKANPLKPDATTAERTAQLAETEQAALKDTIEMEIYVAAFKASGNTLPQSAVDADLRQTIKREYKGDKARFERAVLMEGATMEEYRKKRERTIIFNVILKKLSELAPPPTEVEIQHALELRTAEAPQRQVQIRTLSIPKYDAKRENDTQYKLAQDIHAKLKAGQDFGALAKKFSADGRAADGGKMDWASTAILSPALAEPLSKLKPGELSEVLDLGTLWFILKFDGERQQSKPAEQIKAEVVEELKKQKTAEFQASWLKNTRDKLKVQIVPKPESAEKK